MAKRLGGWLLPFGVLANRLVSVVLKIARTRMSQKYFVAGIGILVSLTLSGCSVFYPNSTPKPTPTKTSTTEPTPSPTPEPTVEPKLSKVEIAIIDSSAFLDNGYVEVVAEALNVLEDDGKCTLTLTQGKTVQKVTVSAVQNVRSTVCTAIQVPIKNFKATNIDYSVTYVSSKSEGTSEPGTIQIQ